MLDILLIYLYFKKITYILKLQLNTFVGMSRIVVFA